MKFSLFADFYYFVHFEAQKWDIKGDKYFCGEILTCLYIFWYSLARMHAICISILAQFWDINRSKFIFFTHLDPFISWNWIMKCLYSKFLQFYVFLNISNMKNIAIPGCIILWSKIGIPNGSLNGSRLIFLLIWTLLYPKIGPKSAYILN